MIYDPCLDFFHFFIVLFLLLPGHTRGQKLQTNTLILFRLAYWPLIMFIYFLHIGKICSCTWINRNCEQSWLFSKVTTPTKSTCFIKSCEIKVCSDFPQQTEFSYTSHLSFKAWILKQFKSLHPFFLRMVSHFATWPNKHFVGSKSLSSRYRTAFRLRRKITYLLRVQEFCSCSELRQSTSAHKQIIPWQHFPTLLPAPPDKECRSKLLSQW